MPPFPNAAAVNRLEPNETRVWTNAQEADEAIAKSGLLVQDEPLQAYLQQIAERLFPEFQGAVRAHVFRGPQLNAFCLPNGSFYMNQGLLARMENEAQAAAVIGHEIAHFTHRHGYAGQQTLKQGAAFAVFAGTLTAGLSNLAVNLLAVAAVTGHSRDAEREADRVGHSRMVAAGYDAREAVKVFRHLQDDVKLSEIKEPYFFGSHPKLQERIDNFQQLAAKSAPGKTEQERFLQATAGVRRASLELDLSMNRQANVILVLEKEQRRATYGPEAHYYLGEAYRLRDKEGDATLARTAYQRAIEAAPQFAPSYRALGIAQMKNKEYSAAAQQFEKYLALAPDAQDRGYIEQYLETVKEKAKQ